MIRKLVALGILTIAACGGEGEPDPNNGNNPDLTGPFAKPADLSEGSCAAGSMRGFDPKGVWHLDRYIGDFPRSPLPMRIDGEGPFTARYNGLETSDARLDENNFFVRLETDEHRAIKVASYDFCNLTDENHVRGRWGICNVEDRCFQGTFNAVRVERIEGESDADGLQLLGEFSGREWQQGAAVNVRVRAGLAYISRFEDGLRIVDAGDPANIRDVGHLPTESPLELEIYNDVKLVDGPNNKRWALMASDIHGVVAVDVTDPEAPVRGPSIPPEGGNVHTLYTEVLNGRTIAYLAHVPSLGMQAWDVTDPENATLVSSFVHPEASDDRDGFVHDLFAENGRVYLNYWGFGLVVVQTTTTSTQAELVGQFDDYERRTSHSSWVTTTSSGRKVAVHGDEDFGAHVRIVDVDPQSATFLEQIGEFALRPEVSVHNIMASGDRAYVAYYQDGVRILDISDPTRPTEIAHLNTWSPDPPRNGRSFYEGATGLDVDLANQRIYVADTQRDLLVLEIPD